MIASLFAAGVPARDDGKHPAIAKAPPESQPNSIHEEMFVPIGGIKQWITITGDDRDNPVILFLHGGPGDAWSPFADAWFRGWEKDFTLVQWDQRGAGRTYGKTGRAIEPTMTIERMRDDGIEVTEFLAKHLHKKRIVLEGGSWGSILGIYMIRARPDLFYAYVGVAQIVNWNKNLSASYKRVLELAQAAGDRQATSALTAIGAPPWDSISKWPIFRKWKLVYQAKLATAAAAPSTISAAYASSKERAAYAAADDFNFEHFWGLTMSGPLTKVDLPALGTDFAVPIFIIQGQEDLTAVPEMAKSYLDSVNAPRKEIYLVPGTGHDPSVAELDLILKVLKEEVRPMTLQR